MATQIVLTYKDYEVLPADGRRYELHDGELIVTPAAAPRHQRVSGRLYRLLQTHVETQRLGEVLYSPIDCILSDTTILQPDLVYLDAQRQPAISGRGIEGPPTLVVEILSPSTAQTDRGAKRQLYARYGVPYYWIADPDARTIEAYRLTGGAYQLAQKMEGEGPITLPPFTDLVLVPAGIWP